VLLQVMSQKKGFRCEKNSQAACSRESGKIICQPSEKKSDFKNKKKCGTKKFISTASLTLNLSLLKPGETQGGGKKGCFRRAGSTQKA